jgi:hypothetical protein
MSILSRHSLFRVPGFVLAALVLTLTSCDALNFPLERFFTENTATVDLGKVHKVGSGGETEARSGDDGIIHVKSGMSAPLELALPLHNPGKLSLVLSVTDLDGLGISGGVLDGDTVKLTVPNKSGGFYRVTLTITTEAGRVVVNQVLTVAYNMLTRPVWSTVTTGDQSMTLDWYLVDGSGVSYDVYHSQSPAPPTGITVPNVSGSTALTYTASSLPVGYYYAWVRAGNSAEKSDWSERKVVVVGRSYGEDDLREIAKEAGGTLFVAPGTYTYSVSGGKGWTIPAGKTTTIIPGTGTVTLERAGGTSGTDFITVAGTLTLGGTEYYNNNLVIDNKELYDASILNVSGVLTINDGVTVKNGSKTGYNPIFWA